MADQTLYERPYFGGGLSVGKLRVDYPDNIAAVTPVVTITSAQLKALNATPQTGVAAPGAGRILVPILVQLHKPAGTAYAGIAAGEDLVLRYTDGSGTICMAVETTGFLDQATAQERIVYGWQSAAETPKAELIPTANAALVFHLLSGEITTGTSPLYAQVYYHIVPALIS